MWSTYAGSINRKQESEVLKRRDSDAIDRAVRSAAHRRRTEAYAAQYAARVEEWMAATLAADVPPLPPKHMTISDINVKPGRFYRSTTLNGAASTAKLSGGSQASLHSDSPFTAGMGLQISPSRYMTERERLEVYESSATHNMLTGKEPYSDPMRNEFRGRKKTLELAGPFVYHATRNERQRVQNAITDRDIGGRAFPYEQPPLMPTFRTVDKSKHLAGEFRARLPSLPVFSREHRIEGDTYMPLINLRQQFRTCDPTHNVSRQDFKTHVPSDRFLALPPDNPRAPKPPVSDASGVRELDRGLGSSGIYALSTGNGSETSRPPRAYWKALTTLAHAPPGAQTERVRRDAETAKELFQAYRAHLNY